MHLRHEAMDETSEEYGGRFRRFFPWPGVPQPDWGGAVLELGPGESSTPHGHDEEEMFLFLAGDGLINIDGAEESVHKGAIVYLPRFSEHFVRNTSLHETLSFVCIWWGAPTQKSGGDEAARVRSDTPIASPFY